MAEPKREMIERLVAVIEAVELVTLMIGLDAGSPMGELSDLLTLVRLALELVALRSTGHGRR